jgi:hypothetical protein
VKKFCGDLRTHGEATPAEKQEAMNGTGDMARNPRKGDAAAPRQKQDKGDITPNKRGRPETRNVIIGDILLGCRDRNEVIERGGIRRTGNEDDNENAVE